MANHAQTIEARVTLITLMLREDHQKVRQLLDFTLDGVRRKTLPLLRVNLFVGYPALVLGRMLFFFRRAISWIGDNDGSSIDAYQGSDHTRPCAAACLPAHRAERL
jgi:hypothetical protein